MTLRRNRGAATQLPAKKVEDGINRYLEWHWYTPDDLKRGAKGARYKLVDWPDADYPERLVECGRLIELRLRVPGQRRNLAITLAGKEANRSHLCFDPDHPAQRLYICSSPAVRAEAKARFWGRGGERWNLNDLAEAIGDRHGTRDYPDVTIEPVGILSDVIYSTPKQGDFEDDGEVKSSYIHAMGEEGGTQPALAVDRNGRFWVAGGSYTCPTPGITS
jgi:hypothetical protein